MSESFPCLITGCDFAVEANDDWQEQLEQHVRWFHLPARDFGENPVPILFSLLANGLIRSEEFSQYVTEILNHPNDRIERIEKAGDYLGLATAFTVAGMLAVSGTILFDATWLLAVTSISMLLVFVQVIRLVRLNLRSQHPGTVRVGVYPDTHDDADDEGRQT